MDINLKSNINVITDMNLTADPLEDGYNLVSDLRKKEFATYKINQLSLNNDWFDVVGELKTSMSLNMKSPLAGLYQSGYNEISNMDMIDGTTGKKVTTFRYHKELTIEPFGTRIELVMDDITKILLYNLSVSHDGKVVYDSTSDISMNDFNDGFDEEPLVRTCSLFLDDGRAYVQVVSGKSQETTFEVDVDLIYS